MVATIIIVTMLAIVGSELKDSSDKYINKRKTEKQVNYED